MVKCAVLRTFIYKAFATVIWCSGSNALEASKISVEGWATPPMTTEVPASWLGNDPVLGRLICPPFSRLNLKRRRNESPIFHSVKVSDRDGKSLWRYEIRSGLHWWDGRAVGPSDFEKFLSARLSIVAQRKFGGVLAIPRFKVQKRARSVDVIWQGQPKFGPYVLNGEAFFSPGVRSGFRFQCVGIYRPKVVGKDSYELEPSPGYRFPRPLIAWNRPGKRADRAVKFGWADSQPVDAKRRAPDRAASCPLLVDTAWASVLEWTRSETARNQELRRLMNGLVPKATLLNSGAGKWGTVSPFLVPRRHPGYWRPKPSKRTGSGSFRAKLASLGYRYLPDERRLFSDSKKSYFQLFMSTALPDDSPQLVRKVLADSFEAAGVDVRLVGNPALADAALTGYYLPLPEMDLLPDFHSSKRTGHILRYSDSALDGLLERYAASLTFERPDFLLLKKAQERLDLIQPVSVIMQHRVCLELSRGWKTAGVDTNDPDWFRKLIL